MMNRVTGLVFLIVTTLAVAGFALAGDGADEKGIEQAVLNYVSSIYDMKPELLDESVHPKLQKVGYMPAEDGSGYKESWMTHAR